MPPPSGWLSLVIREVGRASPAGTHVSLLRKNRKRPRALLGCLVVARAETEVPSGCLLWRTTFPPKLAGGPCVAGAVARAVCHNDVFFHRTPALVRAATPGMPQQARQFQFGRCRRNTSIVPLPGSSAAQARVRLTRAPSRRWWGRRPERPAHAEAPPGQSLGPRPPRRAGGVGNSKGRIFRPPSESSVVVCPTKLSLSDAWPLMHCVLPAPGLRSRKLTAAGVG